MGTAAARGGCAGVGEGKVREAYSTPGMGRNQVRLAYVLNKKDILRALLVLEKALGEYNKK